MALYSALWCTSYVLRRVACPVAPAHALAEGRGARVERGSRMGHGRIDSPGPCREWGRKLSLLGSAVVAGRRRPSRIRDRRLPDPFAFLPSGQRPDRRRRPTAVAVLQRGSAVSGPAPRAGRRPPLSCHGGPLHVEDHRRLHRSACAHTSAAHLVLAALPALRGSVNPQQVLRAPAPSPRPARRLRETPVFEDVEPARAEGA